MGVPGPDPAKAGRRGRSNGKPIARASSGAGGAPGIRRRSTDARCRERRVSCSIRLSACASGSGYHQGRRCGSRFATGMASDRDTAQALARKYHDPSATVRTFALAMHARAKRPAIPGHLGRRGRALRAPRVAGARHRRLAPRGAPTRSRRTSLVSPGLWPHAISGDLPILLVRVAGDDGVPLVRQVLQAQEYWRLKGLSADVVILNEHPISYLDEMQAQLTAVLEDGPWSAWQHRPGRRLSAARRPDGPRRAGAARGRGECDSARRPRRPAARSSIGPTPCLRRRRSSCRRRRHAATHRPRMVPCRHR